MWFVILILLLFILIVRYNKQLTKWSDKEIEKLNRNSYTNKEQLKRLDAKIAAFEEGSKELEQMEHQTFIEQKAHNIRLVVVIYVDSIKEPWPYKLKKELPLLKEAHKQVLSFFNSPYYSEIIKEAEFDLFHGEFKILGNKTRYKKFFAEYIKSPNSLDLYNIKKQMPERYLEDFDESLFCI